MPHGWGEVCDGYGAGKSNSGMDGFPVSGPTRGTAECRYLINSAGPTRIMWPAWPGWSYRFSRCVTGYYVTVPMAGLTADLPCFRIPELTLYGRVRDAGLLLGGWEPKSLSQDPQSYSPDNEPPPVVTDWPVLDSFETSFRALFPTAEPAQKSWVGKGWPTFTPDGRFLIGESSRVPGFVMVVGAMRTEFQVQAALGKLLVESLLDPNPGSTSRSLSRTVLLNVRSTGPKPAVRPRTYYETYYGV